MNSSKKKTFERQGLRAPESGSASSTILLLSLAAIAFYVLKGREFMLDYPASYDAYILLGLTAITLFSLMFLVRLCLFDDTALREAHSNTSRLRILHASSDKALNKLEARLARNPYIITGRGVECFALARRITNALNERCNELDNLLKSNCSLAVRDAQVLSKNKFILSDHPLDSVMGAACLPPLSPEDLEETLDKLLEQIHFEMERKVA